MKAGVLSWLAPASRLLVCISVFVTVALAASAQPAKGAIWNGQNHQPEQLHTHRLEEEKGFAASPGEIRSHQQTLYQINRKLLGRNQDRSRMVDSPTPLAK